MNLLHFRRNLQKRRELLLLNHSLVRLPSHQTIPIHSPSNLSGRLGFGFVISRTNKPRFASRLHTSRNRFIPSSFSFTRVSAGQVFDHDGTRIAHHECKHTEENHCNRNFIVYVWRKIGEELSN
ncbi:hypothetical protein TNCT_349061 [Trichonephila clavata]|uniref:Uncharacterized protein n=1 Tax=Trichonephila clavata TaxID=2740835 RepID=A0A8X6KRX8_TRICU|nr:hypothetical protein TNCT_349061 [Trichonephila clavata]